MNLRSLAACLLIAAATPAVIHAAQDAPSQQAKDTAALEYKMISGFKQPFNDDLQAHFSKGWKPVGGVSVAVWNSDLYFAQLLSRPVGGQ